MNFFEHISGKIIWEGVKFLLLVCCLVLIIYFNLFFKQEEKVINDTNTELISVADVVKSNEKTQQEEKIEEDVKLINVDLKGAVKKEGVYTVQLGSTVNDIVKLAGGLKNNGTLKNINLSKRVEDEMVIYVYTNYELSKANVSKKVSEECVVKQIYIDDCQGESIIKSDNKDSVKSDNNQGQESNSKVNINTATLDELMQLNGIGEAKAKTIIEYRTQNGNFAKIEDLMNVTGIGEALYQKVKDSITV